MSTVSHGQHQSGLDEGPVRVWGQREGHGKCWEGMFGEERSSPAELTAPTLRPYLRQTAVFRRAPHCACIYLLPCLCSPGSMGSMRHRSTLVCLCGFSWDLCPVNRWERNEWMRRGVWTEEYKGRTTLPALGQVFQQRSLCFHPEAETCWGRRASRLRCAHLSVRVKLATLFSK